MPQHRILVSLWPKTGNPCYSVLDGRPPYLKFLPKVLANFREFALACGAIEVDDDMGWHLLRYAESMSSRTVTRDSKTQVPVHEYNS